MRILLLLLVIKTKGVFISKRTVEADSVVFAL